MLIDLAPNQCLSCGPRQDRFQLLRLAEADLESIVSGLREWTSIEKPVCALDLNELEQDVAVTRMVCRLLLPRSDAREHHEQQWSMEDELLWSRLQSLGLACCDDGQWALTPVATASVITMQDVKPSRPVYSKLSRAECEDIETLKKASGWQLLVALQEEGWTIARAPSSKKARLQLAPVQASSGPGRLWIIGKTVSKQHAYLVCLLARVQLKHMRYIYHCQEESYYLGLLSGHISGELQVDHDEPSYGRRNMMHGCLQRDDDHHDHDVPTTNAESQVQLPTPCQCPCPLSRSLRVQRGHSCSLIPVTTQMSS